MLLDLFLRAWGIDTEPLAGWIVPPGHSKKTELGHVWLELDGSYVLDVTLTQFQTLLGLPVPAVVCGDIDDVTDRYHYRNDEQGAWEYAGHAVAALVPEVRQ